MRFAFLHLQQFDHGCESAGYQLHRSQLGLAYPLHRGVTFVTVSNRAHCALDQLELGLALIVLLRCCVLNTTSR